MKLRFTPRAVANLAEIIDYIHERNPAAAGRVRTAIYDSLQSLILFLTLAGARRRITRKYAYLVYYMVNKEAEEIVILNVKHPARRREHEDA